MSRIICPKKSGSLYFNYKKFFSIVLMALVGPLYEFLYVDARVVKVMVVFSKLPIFIFKMVSNELGLPPSEYLLGATEKTMCYCWR